MLYDMINSEGVLGTFETSQRICDVIKILKACYGELVLIEHKTSKFRNRFYVYRYVNGDFRDIEELGIFETDLSMLEAYDYMFQIFNKEPDGIFVRKEKICLY